MATQTPQDSSARPVTVVTNCHVVTMDGGRAEHASGHVVVEGNRITAVGDGPAPAHPDARVVDGSGCLLTPGLVNTHHHLYQWVTRGQAVDGTLFEWLTTLYPVWARIDERSVGVSAQASLTQLARTGCTTSSDHHYVFPRAGGDLLGATVDAARTVGLRFHPCRGAMDLGASDGGLPPDSVVEDREAALAATESAIDRWHDPAPDAMVRIAVAPCSPFSVTPELMREAAELARRRGVLLHTHLAETTDEESFCRERFGRSSLDYAADLGWLGDDVWFAHAIHLDDAGVKRVGDSHTGVAHCPSSNARLGAGIARARDLKDAGARIGLGVDGAASNEAASLLEEVRHGVLFARARGGPQALTVRDGLEMATRGGAAVLGRLGDIGSIETGKLADLALWRLDTLAHAGIDDPVAALVLGAPPPLELLLVNGQPVVERDRVVTVDEDELARRVATVGRDLMTRLD
jgi:cytosine/adenosine deaminase-related metal-dependent hydrolase